MAAAPALKLDSVARRFSRRWVLRGVSLEIAAGEAVALMGRNGSGKTTLLRVAATVLRPTRGSGNIFGYDLIAQADKIREAVGLLGHQAGLYDELTAAENLRFALQMCGSPVLPSRIQQVLGEVGLASEAKERVRGFSAGMRRRLALARLIMRKPRLLLLDEPFAAFDQQGIDFLNDVVRRTLAQGGAALVATHDLGRAQGITRVLRIEDGRVSETRGTELSGALQDSLV